MQKEVEVKMSNPMEATPIANLVQLANHFSSSIYFQLGNVRVNAKSIMGMMSLVLSPGSTVIVSCEGDDEQEAITSIEEFLSK